MPSGYTAPIEETEGFTFEQFLWRCARAFATFVDQRDEPLSAPARLPPKENRHRKAVRAEMKELRRWQAMSEEDVEAAAKSHFDTRMAEWTESEARRVVLVGKYDAILEKALAWEPPTPEHVRLKEFMLEQIEESVRYSRTPREVPVLMTAQEYRDLMVDCHKRSADYHRREGKKLNKNHDERAAWVDALRASVPQPKDN